MGLLVKKTLLVTFLFWFINVNRSDEYKAPRVCIIGAGISGLAATRHIQNLNVEITVFEATKHIGGTWKYSPHVGVDEDGITVYTSMYKGLRTNTPYQTMEFSGFPFPGNVTTFPTGSCFYKYIKSFASHYNIYDYIKFQSLVTSVKWEENNWSLTYMKTDSRENHTVVCDYVIVSNAQRYGKPKWPKFKGQESFKGSMIHSHDYRAPEPYTNHTVLIVGAGPSGLDLSTTLTEYAARVYHSHHSKVFNDGLYPANYIKKPDIHSFGSNTAMFKDGSEEEIDDVIFCTGFVIEHDFIDPNSGLSSTSEFTLPLYRHIVNIFHPTMLFVGLPKKLFPRAFDKQAEYAAAIISKRFQLPSQAEMLNKWFEYIRFRAENGLKVNGLNDIEDAGEYLHEIIREGNLSTFDPVILAIRLHSQNYRLQDWTNFRNYEYTIKDSKSFKRKYNPYQNAQSCPIDID